MILLVKVILRSSDLVSQGHVKITQLVKQVINVVLSKYELNPSFNENGMTIKAKLKDLTLPAKVILRSRLCHPTCRLGHMCCFAKVGVKSIHK